MKKSSYMNINRIEFIVTHQCTGKCRHCSVGDKLNHSDRHRHVLTENACSAIEQLTRMFDITSVMTFGGEPLLYSDVVCAIHKKSNACGIGMRQLITNGYFTKQDKKCAEAAEALGEAGLTDLLLSVDAFHQETIPLKPVYRFAEYAKETCIPNIRLHPAWVVNESHDNPYNRKTKDILSQFEQLQLAVSAGNNIFMAGNALANLAEYYDAPNLDLADSCGSMPYTEPLTNITSLTIAPCGDVMICGFVIGNIYRESITEIVSQYDPYRNEWMRAILAGGAKALIGLAEQKGVCVDTSQCYSVCDVCHKITAGR